MPKKYDVREWQEKIKLGQRFQERFADSLSWPRYKNYYRNQFLGGAWKGRIIPVNLYFSLLRSMVPQVYFRNPRVTITARRPGLQYELFARILQTVDNWLLSEIMVKDEIKMMIQDSFLAGIGNGVIGYDSEWGFDGSKILPQQQFSLTQFDKKGARIEFNSNINPGMPWFLRCRPEDMIWPWGCTSSRSAEWFAMRVFRQLDDLKSDKKYANTADLQGSYAQVRSSPEGSQRVEVDGQGIFQNDVRWVEVWECHDVRTGEVYATVMDYPKFIREDEDLLQVDGLPAETISFNPDPDYIYGIPDARIIEPQQLELNEIRTQAMKHRRIDIIKLLVRKGVFSREAIQKMTDEQVQAVIEAELNDGGSLKDVVTPIPTGASGIMQDLAFAAEQVRGDVRETVGFSRNAGGEYQGKTHISATETAKVSQALGIRLDERRDMVADLLSRVVRKFNQIIFTHWTQDRVAQIVGPDGAKWWLKFNGPQIKEEYDTFVTPEEGRNLDSQTKFELGQAAAETWAKLNAGQIAQGAPVPAEIQRLLFNQFQDSGLDIDKLLAQTMAGNQQAQQTRLQQAMGAAGQSPDQPINAGVLAQAHGVVGG